jgi:hypothetical protein
LLQDSETFASSALVVEHIVFWLKRCHELCLSRSFSSFSESQTMARQKWFSPDTFFWHDSVLMMCWTGHLMTSFFCSRNRIPCCLGSFVMLIENVDTNFEINPSCQRYRLELILPLINNVFIGNELLLYWAPVFSSNIHNCECYFYGSPKKTIYTMTACSLTICSTLSRFR